MIHRLHYISQETDEKSHLANIEEACLSGVDWVQLRVKNKRPEEVEKIAFKAKIICEKYMAKLIINDHVDIAKVINADGVHLGQGDMNPKTAREILGSEAIIGGTASTWEHIKVLSESNTIDYIGLGPFRFTQTKEKLSPVLGAVGYMTILDKMSACGINIPVIAIGGIVPGDIDAIQKIGCHGIAVASLINGSSDKTKTINSLSQLLKRSLKNGAVTNSRAVI